MNYRSIILYSIDMVDDTMDVAPTSYNTLDYRHREHNWLLDFSDLSFLFSVFRLERIFSKKPMFVYTQRVPTDKPII